MNIFKYVLLSAMLSVSGAGFGQSQSGTLSSGNAEDLRARALLIPRIESTFSSQTSARVRKITVDHGQRFKKGDLLIQFDCAVPYAELKKFKADLMSAEKTHEANLLLQANKAISSLEVAISEVEVEKAKADISRINAEIGMCTIYAPFSGRVVKRLGNPYETVTQGQPLLQVLDDSQLQLQINVPSGWLRWLKTGSMLTVDIDETGQQYPAKVSALGARVDPVSQTLEILAAVEGSHQELLAGMSGVARFKPPQ